MSGDKEHHVLWKGRHLVLLADGTWEYVARHNASGVVGIVALTEDRHLVLIEQHRPPAGGPVLELPAGLSGDLDGEENESSLEAAKRELLEETGYETDRWIPLIQGYSSPGLTDEHVTLFLATDVRKTGPGGGDASEQITIHHVPLDGVLRWLEHQQEQGKRLNLKLLAGLFVAREHLGI